MGDMCIGQYPTPPNEDGDMYEMAKIPAPVPSSHKRKVTISSQVRVCHVLIVCGLLAIGGSLNPAVWRSIYRQDISGGFALAQYILGVGVFIVGSMIVIHSRNCTCWQ